MTRWAIAPRPRRLARVWGRMATGALALVLIWYGAMLALLAAKLSPHTINTISGYRTVYNNVADLRHADFTTPVRLIAGLAGFVAFCFFLWLAAHHLAPGGVGQRALTIADEDDGSTTVKARVIEHLAEITARGHAEVTHATGHLHEDQLDVDIDTCRPDSAAHVLRIVAARILDALAGHELPPVTVNVTITGYEPTTQRQLS
jgi:hypothetical protein